MSCRTHKVSSACLTAARLSTSLTDAQAVSVFHALKARVVEQARRGNLELIAPTEQEYADFLDKSEWRTRTRDDITDKAKRSILRRLAAARTQPMPDATTYTALQGLTDEMVLADHLYKREFAYIAGWRGTSVDEAEAYVTSTREAWVRTPREDRPHPPASWVDTYTRRTHKRNEPSPPTDEATMYAVWKAETDPSAFPATDNWGSPLAIVDLETTGFNTQRNDIIEVGYILVNENGEEEGRESILLSPTPGENGEISTGRADIHHITPDMVQGKPAFAEEAPRVRSLLEGRVFVAQNTPFDYSFLQAKLASSGLERLPSGPMIDTLRIARHVGVPTDDFKLQTLADFFGVDYTDGHRAEHDADVCWKVLQGLRAYSRPTDPIAA